MYRKRNQLQLILVVKTNINTRVFLTQQPAGTRLKNVHGILKFTNKKEIS